MQVFKVLQNAVEFMSDTSLWTSLRNPVFRRLWIASIVSGVCVSAHDTVATWVMNTLTPSMFLISLMSTVAALPFFLFTLPVREALHLFADVLPSPSRFALATSTIQSLAPAASKIAALLRVDVFIPAVGVMKSTTPFYDRTYIVWAALSGMS
jgi:Transmembrane secretion effector